MENDPLNASIFVRCAEPTREALAQLANADRRSLSNYVRAILERHVASEAMRQQKHNKRRRRKKRAFPFAVVQPTSPTAADRI